MVQIISLYIINSLIVISSSFSRRLLLVGPLHEAILKI